MHHRQCLTVIALMQALKCTLNADDCLDGLLKWAHANDLYAPKLQAQQVNGIRGLFATKKIKAGGLLMSVPRTMALSVHEDAPCPFPMFMSDADWRSIPE